MSKNQQFHKYKGLKALATSLVMGIGGLPGRLAGMFLAYLFNFLAMKGIYFINVGLTAIETNMDQNTWEKVASTSWELKDKIDAGLIISPEETKKRSNAFRAAFRKYAVYSRVLNNGNS